MGDLDTASLLFSLPDGIFISSVRSNGPVEAQVNCLKLQKRLMFGRANFDLLRLRILYRA